MSDDILIEALGPRGDGIHRSAQGPVYVERTLPGDRVRAKVHRGTGGVLRGDLIEITTASPHRVVPPCPHYDVCGGCTIQHADAQFYRNWKLDLVRAALHKKDVKPDTWAEPVFLPGGTRRRATFVAFRKGSAVTLGYFRRRSHIVANIDACLLVEPVIMDMRARLATALVPVLNPGKPADIFIQHVDGQCEIAITGAVGAKGRPDLQVYEAIGRLAHDLNVSRVSWRGRERDEPEVMVELKPLYATFGALAVSLPPLAFLQPTRAGEEALITAVMSLMPDVGTFADLFAGCGTFSAPMLARGPVDAYEGVASAVGALDKAKGTAPLRAIERDLFRSPLSQAEVARYDAIVFDPPRAGAEEQVKVLAFSKVPRLIGVSCNPTSFARDARILIDGGYRLETVKVVDQFAWSHHVELVASFAR